MGLIGSFDRTHDTLTVWDSSESVGNATTQNSDVFDLGANYTGSKFAELCQARFRFTTCSMAVGDCVIVNIQGANASDFSGTVYNLGTLAVGAPAIITTTLGVTASNGRGRGEYVLPFYTAGIDGDQVAEAGNQQSCRYIRIQTKTIGATSACVFSVRIEKL